MVGRSDRIGIVGAASLRGKELGDALAESPLAASDVVLLDTEGAAGQIAAAGDEAVVIQGIEEDSFNGMDFVFFAGDAAATLRYWKAARSAGASIVDMTYALEDEAGVVVRAPWTGLSLEGQEATLDLTTPAVVSAHPATLALLLVAGRLDAARPLRAMYVTLFEPASEHGQAAMDELHQQTVSLLSFQSLPREQYDAQVAFNLLPSIGDAARVRFSATKELIAKQFRELIGLGGPALFLQLIQAPVFHGYAASILLELQEAATVRQVEAALQGQHVDLVGGESDPPSNLSAAGQSNLLMRVSAAEEGATTRFWLWFACDNLKLSAMNAIACANELRRLRPQGSVQ